MNRGERQVIAEKIGSTVRVLELLGLQYQVTAPGNERKRGNKSPRVVHVIRGEKEMLRVYNSASGHTWANDAQGGLPIAEITSIETLFTYLQRRVQRKK